MSPKISISAVCLGTKAGQELARSSQAVVLGVTSQGVFLKLSSGWVIFLSGAAEPGPLTLILDAPLAPWVAQGELAQISAAWMDFPSCGRQVSWSQSPGWSTPPPAREPLAFSQRLQILRQVIQLLGVESLGEPEGKAPASGAGRIPRLLFFGLAGANAPIQIQEQMAAALQPLLGFGPGLTPWGDDLVLGLLLTLRRWGALCAPSVDWQPLFSCMTTAAYRTTTLLSANLIECACQGEAGASLVRALDGLVTGDPPPLACANIFEDWGSTSGRAVLRGMLLALDPHQELMI